MERTTVLAAALVAVLAVATAASAHPAATTYYVDKDSLGGPCSDAGPGDSPGAPWCTIAQANARLEAGDTVVIRAGVYAGSIAPARDGAPDRPITYRRDGERDGESRVVLAGVGTAIHIVGRAHIVVDGIDAERVDRFVTLDNSHHVSISGCRFQRHNSQGGWPTGILFKNSSHHNVLRGCTVGGVGYSTADDDIGCVMNLGVWENADDKSDHNLIEGNELYGGGHHVLAISANHNVVRGNHFHNANWMDCQRAETGGHCGNRNVIFEYDPTNVAWNVVEDNWFERSGLPPDDNTSAGMSVRTPHNIVRRNVFEQSDGPGLDISALTGLWDARDNHIYHNVMVHNGYTALPDVEHWKQAGLLVAHHGTGAPVVDLGIKNNILHDNKSHGLMFYYTDRAAQEVSGNWDEAGDPGFDDPARPTDPAQPPARRFQLRPDSPCVDGGVFLTRTTADGAGREIPVEDAGYFSDGREMVEGDLIQLEASAERARVVAIDYEQNVLTVDPPLTWAAGQGVSLPYGGAAPDIGAAELWPPTPTPPPATTPTATPPTARHRLYLPSAHKP